MLHTMNNNNNNNNNKLPHGLGLLTTVASLPPKYRSRYLYIKTKYETPLDLTVKPISPLPDEQPQPQQHQLQQQQQQQQQQSDKIETTTTEQQQQLTTSTNTINETTTTTTTTTIIDNGHTMTPPLTPPAHINLDKFNKKRKFAKISEETNVRVKIARKADNDNEALADVDDEEETEKLVSKTATPLKTVRANEKTTPPPPPRTHKQTVSAAATTKSNKATRKLKFDEEHSSPVSGTIIRPLEDITDGTVQYSNGDIDPRYNIVEISEESKAELAAIKNVIGDYICKLCRLKFDDAFGLARHRCACIVLLEYRCPECGKQFNCPANLASHRRWHKPKKDNVSAKKENQNTINTTTAITTSSGSESAAHSCEQCGKKFKRQAYLRKHMNTHSKDKPAQKQVSATVVAISYAGSTSSSTSSVHSFGGQTEVTSRTEVSYDFEHEAMYDSSSRSSLSSTGSYGRLQIVEGGLTEEENIAAAALTNLRNCASVIKHTTLAH